MKITLNTCFSKLSFLEVQALNLASKVVRFANVHLIFSFDLMSLLQRDVHLSFHKFEKEQLVPVSLPINVSPATGDPFDLIQIYDVTWNTEYATWREFQVYTVETSFRSSDAMLAIISNVMRRVPANVRYIVLILTRPCYFKRFSLSQQSTLL